MNYINYFIYIMKHKYFVLVASFKFKVNLWQVLTHDLSKFLPSEWFAYMNTFYKSNGASYYNEAIAFTYAWNQHQKINKHHWQYWLITWDRGETEPLPMPEKYVREMLADWAGAGKAITGKWEYKEWYFKNKRNMTLHKETIEIIEGLI